MWLHPDVNWRGLHLKQSCSDDQMIILQSEVGPSFGACVVITTTDGRFTFVAHVVAAGIEIRGYGSSTENALEAAYRKAEAFVERFKE